MASNPPGSWPEQENLDCTSVLDSNEVAVKVPSTSRLGGGLEDPVSAGAAKGKGKERAGKRGQTILPAEILETYACLHDRVTPT